MQILRQFRSSAEKVPVGCWFITEQGNLHYIFRSDSDRIVGMPSVLSKTADETWEEHFVFLSELFPMGTVWDVVEADDPYTVLDSTPTENAA